MNRQIRVGLFLDAATFAMEVRRRIWLMADDAGFDYIWHDDHLLGLTRERLHDQVFESWTMLAAVAEATTHVRMGVLVTGNLYRNPGMLAKMATTVDHISGGRLEMGIGVGWAEPEFRSLGIPFPESVPERIERLDEGCQILKLLWTQDRSDFDGKYYHLVDAISEPKPIQQPHPPIWIGAKGPKRSMRVVARHADLWNVGGARGLEADLETNRILDEHCAAIGRDPAEIRRSAVLEADSVDAFCRLAEGYTAAGFTDFILDATCSDAPRRVDEVVIPAMARIRQLTVTPIG